MKQNGSKINIGINARALMHEEPGGAIQVADEISIRLNDLFENVTLFGHHSLKERYPTVNSLGFLKKSQSFGILWEQSILPVSAIRSSIDVLFCPNANNPFLTYNTPTVVCVHDILNYLGYSPWYYTVLQRFRVPLSLRTADSIITVSEFTKRELTSRLNIKESKINVVHSGVDDVFFQSEEGKKIQVPDQYILFVGGAHKRKNIDGVVEAFKRLKQREDIPHELLLVGPSPRSTYDDTGIDWSDIESDPDIVPAGYVSQRELKYIYGNADTFVFPSYYEGFGLPPLEAMACGTPVVASDRAALPEILGDAAEYVDPDSTTEIASGIAKLLGNDKLRAKRSKAGQKQAEQYRWDSAIDSYQSILEDVAHS